MGRQHVLRVLEAETRSRELRGVADVGFAVASGAGPLVVRLAVATPAVRFGRKVKRPRLPGRLHTHVALEAVDPLEHVRAMLEGVGRRRPPQAEDAGARGNEDAEPK
jgi:hypothetical protein